MPPSETFVARRLRGDRYQPFALYSTQIPGGLSVHCPTWQVASGKRIGLPARSKLLAGIVRRIDVSRALSELRPDVVHAHFGHLGFLVDRQCFFANIPLVVSFYGWDIGTAPRDAQVKVAYRRLFNLASAVTGEAPELLRCLKRLGLPSATARILPLCLPDWALEEPARALDWSETPLRLLQVARFAEKKGIDLTLRALATARRAGARVELDLVGDGELDVPLRELASELQLGDAVRWHGFRPYSELPALLANCHAFIQPSRTAADGDTEGGHPTTLIEALAQGVPVLGSTHADLPFVVKHGLTGLISQENDASALASNILRIAGDRELLARMGAYGRRSVLKRHHPKQLLQMKERIYREACQRHNPTALWRRLVGVSTQSLESRGK